LRHVIEPTTCSSFQVALVRIDGTDIMRGWLALNDERVIV